LNRARRAIAEYGLAVMAVAVTAAFRVAAEPMFGGRPGLVLFILPVAFAAWAGGLGPGLVATALASTVGIVAFVHPVGEFAGATLGDFTAASAYGIAAVVVTFIAAALRTGRDQAEAHASRAERLQAVAAALSEELTAEEAASAVLTEGVQALGGGRGVIARLEPDGETLSIVASVGFDRSGWDRFEHFPVSADYPLSEAVRSRDAIILGSTQALRDRYPDLNPTIAGGGAAIAVPLLDKGSPVGGLYYRFASVPAFAPDAREYLLTLGRLCAGAMERARLREAEHRATVRATFLAQASATLGSSLDFEDTVRRVAELATAALADYCAVYLLEPDGTIRTLALSGPPDDVKRARAILEATAPRVDGPGGLASAIRDGRSTFVPRVTPDMIRASGHSPPVIDSLLALDIGAHLNVPLLANGRAIGALSLTTTGASRRPLTEDDLVLTEQLASRAALAIENARLHSALAARERQQAAVSRLGQLALGEMELEPLFEETVSLIGAVLVADVTNILRLEDPPEGFRLVAGTGWRPELVGTILPDGQQAAYAIEAGDPVIVDRLADEERFVPPDVLREQGVVSGMTVVIRTESGSCGVLGAHSRTHRTFTEDDTNFLVSVASVVGRAIDRRRNLDAEREARDLNRAFIGIVSHELRTPITTIYGGAKMLARAGPLGADRSSIASDVEIEAERLYRLTEDLLVLTRLERRDLVVSAEPVLLERLLERVVESERKSWPSVTLSLAVPPGFALVMGEDNYIEQVARNLITNAAKYSAPGGTVEIAADRDGSEVCVRVLDRGPGIRGEDPLQLFGLFYRSPTTAQQASGAGIGLFVCDQLIRAMGGRVWARPREGGGAEFGFALQGYVDADEAMPVSPAAMEPLSVTGEAPNGNGPPVDGKPLEVVAPGLAATARGRGKGAPIAR
jgi:K+-sensing histidine kinase KdpD